PRDLGLLEARERVGEEDEGGSGVWSLVFGVLHFKLQTSNFKLPERVAGEGRQETLGGDAEGGEAAPREAAAVRPIDERGQRAGEAAGEAREVREEARAQRRLLRLPLLRQPHRLE